MAYPNWPFFHDFFFVFSQKLFYVTNVIALLLLGFDYYYFKNVFLSVLRGGGGLANTILVAENDVTSGCRSSVLVKSTNMGHTSLGS